jgi:hypothetical protein
VRFHRSHGGDVGGSLIEPPFGATASSPAPGASLVLFLPGEPEASLDELPRFVGASPVAPAGVPVGFAVGAGPRQKDEVGLLR